MSTTENNLPAAESDEAIGSALSIDQPTTNTGPIVPAPDDYDGAAPSDEPAAEVTTRTGKKLLRMDLGDGNVYTAETERELLQKVADGKREANKTIREMKAREHAAPAPQAQNITVTPRTTVDNSDLPAKYDDETYLKMLGESPIKAMRYLNRELYGDIDPVQALRHSYTTANQVNQHLTVAEFQRRNPDFIASPETSQALMGVLQDNRLAADSIVNLEWAFREAQRTGRIQAPVTNADGEVEYEDISFDKPAPARAATTAKPPARRGANAPPSAGGGSGGEHQPAPFDPYSVPLEELRASINSGGKSLRR